MKGIRVAVVDDSSFVRRAIERLLRDEPRIEVVGAAATGEELLAHLAVWRPQVVTLDLAMPGMGGLATLDRLMKTRPTPVIILSTHSGRGAPQTIEALHRGAVDFIDKQRYSLMDFDALRKVLVVKIVEVHDAAVGSRPPKRERGYSGAEPAHSSAAQGVRLVAMGASTGGPPAIQRILEAFRAPLPVPVVIAQHMPPGFTRAFADRLNAHLPFPVREAVDGEQLLRGTAYVAPAGRHFLVGVRGDRLRAEVIPDGGESLYSPSVDRLFGSACDSLGSDVIAVLLSGMGRDGAQGMLSLRQAGAYTIAQDESSCVVYGMPAAAVALQAATETLPLDRIGPRLRDELFSADQAVQGPEGRMP